MAPGKFLLSTILLGTALFAVAVQAHDLQPVIGLLTPESVVQAADGKVYISEINGFGTDGDGQIRVIDHNQSSLLVQGLDDPKGLAISGPYLLIADKTKILRVNLKQHPAKAEVYVDSTAFPKVPQFLNDLDTDAKGNLYVSDSGDILGTGKGGAVYKITPQRKVMLLIDGNLDARVLAPNGLLADATGEHLLMVDFTSGVLYRLNTANQQLQEIANGLGGGDGIVQTANGDIYVSDWKSGKVFLVDSHGQASLLKEGYQSAADIALSTDGKHLLVPDMKAGQLDVIHLHH